MRKRVIAICFRVICADKIRVAGGTRLLVLAALAAFVAGCSTHRDAETSRLSSGRTIRVVDRRMIRDSFTFHYCAGYDFDHLDGLRAEVKEVWRDLQLQAEQSGATDATIWANNCRWRLVWPS